MKSGKRKVTKMDESLLKSEERAVLALRALYRRYGYLPFRMSKFEEYELYMRNKDFLVSDRIIAFNDTNGRLLALKPDVTLSIIKSGEDRPGYKQKVYYNENVYRVSESTHHYKEILQAGLECIGDIDLYDIYEVIALAAESLALISEAPDAFLLEISHLGLLSAVLDRVCPDKTFADQAIRCISGKNLHDLRELCRGHGIGEKQASMLEVFVTAYGERKKVTDALEAAWDHGPEGEAEKGPLEELKALSCLLDTLPFSDRIRFDFSVVNDMNYYNGFVFKGFLKGVSGGVLAGGQYDKMMARMERSSGAVGFAVYLDLLEQLGQERTEYDVDVLLVYDDNTCSHTVAEKVRELAAAGKSVTAQRTVPERPRCREVLDLRGQGVPGCPEHLAHEKRASQGRREIRRETSELC